MSERPDNRTLESKILDSLRSATVAECSVDGSKREAFVQFVDMVKSGAIESYDLYEVSAQTINVLLKDGQQVIKPLLYSKIIKHFADRYMQAASPAQFYDMKNGTKDLHRVNENFFGNEKGEFDKSSSQLIDNVLNATCEKNGRTDQPVVIEPFKYILTKIKDSIPNIEHCDGR